MAYNIKTKDGIVVNDIPEEFKPDAPEVRARVAELRAARGESAEPVVATFVVSAQPQQPAAEQPAAEPSTTVEGLMGAVVRGAAPVATGAAIGGALGAPAGGIGAIPGAAIGAGTVAVGQLVGDPVVTAVNQAFGTNYQLPTEAIQDMFTRLGVAQPQTAVERTVQTAAAGAGGAGGMVGAGRALAMGAPGTVAGQSGMALAAQPVQQIAGGAGAGAAGQAAAEQGAGLPAQLAAGLAGGMGAAGLAGTRVLPAAERQQAQRAVTEAERSGITPMTSDVVPPTTFAGRWLQSTGERIPLAGTGGVRAEQQTQRVEAVRNVLRDFGADDAAQLSTNVMADLAGKRSADLGRYSTLKNEVIDRLNEKGQVPVVNATADIDAQIARLQSMKSAEVQPIIARLQDFKASLQGQGLRNVEELRKQLGESFKDPSLTAVRSQGEKAVSSIYGALRKDMGDHIRAVGEKRDVTKWEVANKRLSEMAGELKVGALKSALNKGDATPEVVDKLLFSKKPSEVMALYRGLTESGKANARAALLAKAAEKANRADGFSPDVFANEFKKLHRATGVFFTGDQRKQVDGLIRALELTKRASGAAATPATGVQVAIPVGAAVLTDLLGGAGAATAGGLTIGGLARLVESPRTRNLLMKIPTTKKGSEEEAELVKRIAAVVQTRPQIQQDQGNE